MALLITNDCINCDACEPECPNGAISMGLEATEIDPAQCTECVGFFDKPQCVAICPVDCIIVDPQHSESREQLQKKHQSKIAAAQPAVASHSLPTAASVSLVAAPAVTPAQAWRPSVRSPSVVVDPNKCIASKGCRSCIDACPLDILAIDEQGRVHMAYDECWYCLPCEAECPTKAISVQIPYLLR